MRQQLFFDAVFACLPLGVVAKTIKIWDNILNTCKLCQSAKRGVSVDFGLVYCKHCDSPVEEGSNFCPGCGHKTGLLAGGTNEGAISWETDISLVGNRLILKQIIMVTLGAGFSIALILSFIFAATGQFRDIPPMLVVSLAVTAGFGCLIFLTALLFFGNRIRVRFTINEKGALWQTTDKRALTANRLALLAGVLGRGPQTAGAGTLALSREKEFVAWQDLAYVEYDQRQRMVVLRNSWRPVMMLSCLPESYGQVSSYIHGKVPTAPANLRSNRKPLLKALFRTGLAALAAAPLFSLSASYYIDFGIFLPLLMFMFALAVIWLVPLFGWVVIASIVVMAVQLVLIGIEDFTYLFVSEQILYITAWAGLVYLAWFSWGSLRGRFLPPLMED